MTEPENRSKTRSLIKIESLLKDSIDIGDYITKKFDYVVKSDLYNHNSECLVYDLVRQIAIDKQNLTKRPMIVMSPDIAISSATLSGSAERNMRQFGHSRDLKGSRVDGVDFESDIRVLYISSKLGLCTENYEGIESYQKSIMSNTMGLTTQSFTRHNINVDPNKVVYLGIRSDLIENSEQATLDAMAQKPMVFDLERVRSKGIDRIMRYVKNRFKGQKVHIVLDMSSIDITLAPSVFRFRQDRGKSDASPFESEEQIKHEFRGLNREEILTIMQYASELKLEGNLEEFDLIGYNFSVEEFREQAHPANLVTSKIMLDILKCIADFTEHSINIFDENSKFLIWKRIPKVFTEEEDFDPSDDPKGWYILRNVDLNTRNELIAHFDKRKEELHESSTDSNVQDTAQDIDSYLRLVEYPIERFEFPDGDDTLDVLISVTCPAEQKLKSYHTSSSYQDRCLMPGEKVNMTFELLSTPATVQALNQNIERFGEPENDPEEFDDISENSDDSSEDSGIDPGDMMEYRDLYAQYQSVVKNSQH